MNARGLTSTAVMARRHEPADSLDFFPTPPWATRALCEYVLPVFEPDCLRLDAIDPACGEGHMALALRDYFDLVTASDIFAYGFGGVADFLHPDESFGRRDWIITNPPFNLGTAFVKRALSIARRGVAMLVRTAFLEGEERYEELFGPTPPARIAQYVERVPMHRGRWVVNGTTATSYCWLVWHTNHGGRETPFQWIPKSRRVLSRHDDWLRFGGCFDIPKTHAAMKLQEGKLPLTLADIRKNLEARRPATIADVARELGALL